MRVISEFWPPFNYGQKPEVSTLFRRHLNVTCNWSCRVTIHADWNAAPGWSLRLFLLDCFGWGRLQFMSCPRACSGLMWSASVCLFPYRAEACPPWAIFTFYCLRFLTAPFLEFRDQLNVSAPIRYPSAHSTVPMSAKSTIAPRLPGVCWYFRSGGTCRLPLYQFCYDTSLREQFL